MITITIAGPQGSGKTTLAWEIAAAIGSKQVCDKNDNITVRRRFPYTREATKIRIVTVQEEGPTQAEQTTIKVGDVVRLASGGPFMTVTRSGKEEVIASWFNELGGYGSERFPIASLLVGREAVSCA